MSLMLRLKEPSLTTQIQGSIYQPPSPPPDGQNFLQWKITHLVFAKSSIDYRAQSLILGIADDSDT